MATQPHQFVSSVPEWARKSFEVDKFQEWLTTSPLAGETARALLFDARMVDAWTTFRRHPPIERLRDSWLVGLVATIAKSKTVQGSPDTMTPAERRKLATVSAEQARRLARLWDQLSRHGDFDVHVQSAISDTPVNSLSVSWRRIHEAGAGQLWWSSSQLSRDGAFVLRSFAVALEQWAKKRPLVTGRRRPTAARTHLMRSLTKFFDALHGKPLRGAVLAITSLFYDVDGLDEDAVKALCPVGLAAIRTRKKARATRG